MGVRKPGSFGGKFGHGEKRSFGGKSSHGDKLSFGGKLGCGDKLDFGGKSCRDTVGGKSLGAGAGTGLGHQRQEKSQRQQYLLSGNGGVRQRRGKYQVCHVFGHWARECQISDILEQRGGDGMRACVNAPEQVAAGSRCRGGGDKVHKVQVTSAVETALSTSVDEVVEQLYNVKAIEVETGSAVQSEPQKVAGVSVSVSPSGRLSRAAAAGGDHVMSTVAAGSMTSRADGTYQQRPWDRSRSASPEYPMEDISGKVAIVATSVNEVLQQLSSLTQVVCDMRGCVYGGSGGVDERGTSTPGDSLSTACLVLVP